MFAVTAEGFNMTKLLIVFLVMIFVTWGAGY